MKKTFLTLTLSLFCLAAPIAQVVAQDYLMWQLPPTKISFPVYIYQGGNKIGFIPSDYECDVRSVLLVRYAVAWV